MLKYLQTTTLILGWCLALALAWGYVSFWIASRRRAPRRARLAQTAVVPALVLAPVALLVAFRALDVNLLFPVHVVAELGALVVAGLAPALVLVLASGLAGQLARTVAAEYEHWRAKTFTTVALAVGRDARAELRRLVLVRALADAWSQCLPWLFGELVVVEAVFNAPGLGLDAWHLARTRDLAGLAEAIGWLALLYVACAALAAGTSRWVGRRLESYA